MLKFNQFFQLYQTKKDHLENQIKKAYEYYLNKSTDSKNKEVEILEASYYYTVQKLKQMDFNIQNGNLKLVQTNNSRVKIVMKSTIWYDKDNWNNAEEYFFNEAIFDIQDKILEVKVPTANIEVDLTVEVPKQVYQNIAITLKNGNLVTNHLSADYLFIRIFNGQYHSQNDDIKKIDLNVQNGNIKSEQVKVRQLSISLSNGHLDYEGVLQQGRILINNGSIMLQTYKQPSQLICKVNNGDINLTVPSNKDPMQIEADTKMGQIMVFDQVYNKYETVSSDIQNTSYQLILMTKHGNIVIQRGDK